MRALEAKLDRVTASNGTPWQLSADGCGGISKLKSSFVDEESRFWGRRWPKYLISIDNFGEDKLGTWLVVGCCWLQNVLPLL